MPISYEDVLLKGFRGKFGNLFILRYYAGRSVMSNVHNYSKKVWSESQKETRLNFRLAVNWAKIQLKDEKILRYYKKRAKGAQNAMNVAIADYMKNLRARDFDVTGYKGRPGDPIRVMLRKHFGATSVRFSIFGPRGVILETGMATGTREGITWNYKASGTGSSQQPVWIESELIRGPVSIKETFKLPNGFQ